MIANRQTQHLRTPVALYLVLLALFSGALAGQEGAVTFEFSLSNPGARSMGLGGAFAALADDATAAFANPAGLAQLLEPELSLEARSWTIDTSFVQGGRARGLASGLGIDTSNDLRFASSSTSQEGISFASFVVPENRWSWAIYYHVSADFALESEVNGLFGFDDEGNDARSEDVLASTRVKVENLGLATSFEITDQLSLGLGFVYYEASMDSLYVEYAQDDETLYERTVFAREQLDTSYMHQGSSSGFRLNVGVLWQLSRSWSLGAFYRPGPELDIRVIETVGPADNEVPEGTIELDARSKVGLPDVYGIGSAYKSRSGRWTVSAEWSRVTYSQITRQLNTEIFDPGEIELDDGNEFHLGAEYLVFVSGPVVALRAGAWIDPAHQVRAGPLADQFERAVFQRGDDEIHLAGGVGLAFSRVQVDLGIDTSDLGDRISGSLVYRF